MKSGLMKIAGPKGGTDVTHGQHCKGMEKQMRGGSPSKYHPHVGKKQKAKIEARLTQPTRGTQ